MKIHYHRYHGLDLLRSLARRCLALDSPVVAMTIILTFIISVIGYYVLIKFTPISWVVNGCLKSWLQLAFMQGR